MTGWSSDIPLNSKTIVFNEKWVITGDGEVVAIIELDKQTFETIIEKYHTNFNELDKKIVIYNPDNNTDVLYVVESKYLYQEKTIDNSSVKIILEKATNCIIVRYTVW